MIDCTIILCDFHQYTWIFGKFHSSNQCMILQRRFIEWSKFNVCSHYYHKRTQFVFFIFWLLLEFETNQKLNRFSEIVSETFLKKCTWMLFSKKDGKSKTQFCLFLIVGPIFLDSIIFKYLYITRTFRFSSFSVCVWIWFLLFICIILFFHQYKFDDNIEI